MTPNPAVRATVAIDEYELGTADVLEYTDDDGEATSLGEVGGRVQVRDDQDVADDAVFHPIAYEPDALDAAEYADMPRGETFLDSNDEEIEVSVLDAARWNEVGSEISVADIDAASGGPALSISTSGLSSGVSTTARFEDGTHESQDWDFLIDSGEARRMIQLGVNVNDLPSGARIEIRIEESDGTQHPVIIDSSATEDNDDVLATATGTYVYQKQVGDVFGDAIDGIAAIEILVAEADVDGDGMDSGDLEDIYVEEDDR